MMFDKGWISLTNTKEAGFSLTYLNGFKGTGDFLMNEMTDWKVVKAEDN